MFVRVGSCLIMGCFRGCFKCFTGLCQGFYRNVSVGVSVLFFCVSGAVQGVFQLCVKGSFRDVFGAFEVTQEKDQPWISLSNCVLP